MKKETQIESPNRFLGQTAKSMPDGIANRKLEVMPAGEEALEIIFKKIAGRTDWGFDDQNTHRAALLFSVANPRVSRGRLRFTA